MRLTFAICFCFAGWLTAGAQTLFPPDLSARVDAHLEEAYTLHQKKDSASTHLAVQRVDAELATLQNDYPLYRGVIRLFQSFYSFHPKGREHYRTQGIALLKGGGPILADNFSAAFYNVMQLHFKAGRMADWRPVDSAFRAEVAGASTPDALQYGLINYVRQKLDTKQYDLSRQIALYDYYTIASMKANKPMDRLQLMYDDWAIMKSNLEPWKKTSYVFRHPDEFKNQSGAFVIKLDSSKASNNGHFSHDFQSTFKTLLSRMGELKQEMVLQNLYGSAGFDRELRRVYYTLYTALLHDYYTWAVAEHKESRAILPFKEFLYQDLVPHEIEAADKAGVKPVLSVEEIVTLFQDLANLFHGMGNGLDEKETAKQGSLVVMHQKVFTEKEKDYATLALTPARARADRLQRAYESSLESSRLLKSFVSQPDSATARHTEQWERYLQARIEEIYTLLAAGREKAARDSFALIRDAVKLLDDGTKIAPLYSMRAWPHFLYLTATIMAKHGKWMSDILQQSLMEMDLMNDQPDIYYPVQLLYFKSIWHQDKKLSEDLLANLLFYTGRQLRYAFPMLTPEDRMQFFEQKLSAYFDIYHELLFSGHLDAYPQLKEKAVAQSLSLKNALADGNLISNEQLETKGSIFTVDKIERLRRLRREITMFVQQGRLQKHAVPERRGVHDQVQNLWLELLEDTGMDSLSRFTDWRRIGLQLKPGQAYTEVIRYNRWLSDSAAWYGACVLLPGGNLSFVPLFAEAKLTALLQDPAASPQTAALSSDGNRGGILLPKEKPAAKSFQKGSVDRLAELLLRPLWPHLQGNSEWLLVPDGLLNRISFAALWWKDKNLFEHLLLSQLSSSYSLFQPAAPIPTKSEALLVGGLQYGNPATPNTNRLFKSNYYWNYLPGTRKEVQALQAQFTAAGYRPRVLSGIDFPDSVATVLKGYPIIHLATHGFYLDSTAAAAVYAERWDQEAVRYEPLFRCGIAVSNANEPDEEGNAEGYLLGYELANADLRACYLVSLSACETGLGDVRNNLGVDGLSRALKLSGARHLLISLWKVPDAPTAVFMEQFYRHLFSGKTPAQALRVAQAFMSRSYPVTDWAAFVLVK